MAKPKDVPARRTAGQIGQEYAQVCAAIGENEYRLKVGIPRALEELYARALKLNLEAAGAAKEQSNG